MITTLRNRSIGLLGLLFCLLLSAAATAQKVSIGLFFDTPVRAVSFTVQDGSYAVIVNDTLFIADMNVGDVMLVKQQQGLLRLKVADEELWLYASVKAVAMGDEGRFLLACTAPALAPRSYMQHAFFTNASDGAGLLIVNQLDEHYYLCGVVEAEVGGTAKTEFYKVQSILSRTYLYTHFNRHAANGFNLCDGVHCQAFKGVARTKNIRSAVRSTSGIIVIDSSRMPITPAFHANCGGETSSSGYVWREALPYLRSVIDKYCRTSPGAHWQKRIALGDWRSYMNSIGLHANSSKAFAMKQPERKKYYEVGRKKIEITKVRQRFGLRSTFFDVQISGNDVFLSGRGFGHGVGMCQEGAMQMAEQGFSYEAIVKFYYRGTQLINFNHAHSTEEMRRDSMLYLFNPWRAEKGDSIKFVE